MAVATPVDVAVNPNNTAQRYILWGNGRIDPVGGAIPVTDQTTWYARLDPPGVALHVTNWATGAGYVLDYRGGFQPFGGAPALGTGNIVAGIPYASADDRRYVDWAWDPSGSGQGYVLDVYGKLYAFGGASAYPRGAMFSSPLAKKLVMQWTPTKYGIVLDARGGLHDVFTVQAFNTFAYWTGDLARDVVITSWSATPQGYTLDAWGAIHGINGATAVLGSQVPYRPGADVARALAAIDDDPLTFWVVWSGGQQFESVSSTPPSVTAGGGSSEAQTVAITGAPTGGTFTLTYSGQTTAAIARNATAATVQTALRALSNVGSTGVTVTGGPLPAAVTVTFAGSLARTDVAQLTATSSLTGGTTPAVVITTTSPGEAPSPPPTVTGTTRPMLTWTYSDPQSNSQAGWELYVFTQAWVTGHTMTNPVVWASSALVAESGINSTTRGVATPVDLANGAYRMYVRAKDSSGLWSAWSDQGWTQSVPLPATPTGLTATANQAAYTVALSVSATTGGTANLVRFERSDDGGTTWTPVDGADAVTLAATTTATDRFPPFGVTRTYRAIAYATDPAVASTASATAAATITALTYAIHARDDGALGGRLQVQEPVEWTRRVNAGVFDGLDADYPTVVKDGGKPRARRSTVHIFTDTKAAYDVVENLAMSRSTLVYRDPFGGVRYCEVVGDWAAGLFPGAATRHMHTTDLPLVEVKPPTDA